MQNHSVNIWDGFVEQHDSENLYQMMAEYDLLGIQVMTTFAHQAYEFAETLKSIFPDKPIVLGGTHVSGLPIEAIKKPFVDYVVIGEGEITLAELCNALEHGRSTESIFGLYSHSNGNVRFRGHREMEKNIDALPPPARHLFNWERYSIVDDSDKIRLAILTSRGCPYSCAFCSSSKLWQRVRFHSAEYIVREIKHLTERYDVKTFDIWDDLFTTNKRRLKELVDLMQEEELLGEVTFTCMARANTLDEEVCSLLKKLGVSSLNFGFESGNPRILKMLKGGLTLEMNKKAIQLAKKYGFQVYGSLILGSPTETIEEMNDTINFIDYAKAHGVDNLWAFVMTPFPGTEMWEIAKRRGKVSDDMDWSILHLHNSEEALLVDDGMREEFRDIWLTVKDKLSGFIHK
jgi:radical SAM superfamily enzyme YgiQ (UPF0313 family)